MSSRPTLSNMHCGMTIAGEKAEGDGRTKAAETGVYEGYVSRSQYQSSNYGNLNGEITPESGVVRLKSFSE